MIASNYGQSHYPAWYHNLRANPAATVVVGSTATPVLAREAEGSERDQLWGGVLRIFPGYAAYERRAAPRRIPVIVLPPNPTPTSTQGRGEVSR